MYSGRTPAPHWLVVLLFIACVFGFLICIRSLLNPDFRTRFLRFGSWRARIKPGTRISLRSAMITLLLTGSFASLIGMNLFHHSSERIESYLGPLAVFLIFLNLASLYLDERRSGLK
jgi:uncharacterized membrane protein YsdA (DUF1294 family)